MHQSRPYCLSIAGFDPCSGAGLTADIKTFERLRVYGLGVVTGITFQNDDTFNGLQWSNQVDIKNQLEILKKYPVKVIKIGLVRDQVMLEKIIRVIDRVFDRPEIIWDPILKASAGYGFRERFIISKYLTQRITLMTPNYNEYQTFDSEEIKRLNVLVKGGHSEEKGVDVLKMQGKEIQIAGKPFEKNLDKHGTGCVLSSAIAALLAKGKSLSSACREAKKYTEKFMMSNTTKLGYHS